MDIGVKEIDQWHRANGWLKIGYHFVIRRDGTVEVGRDIDEAGAHASGYNNRSIGICLVGGVGPKQQVKPNGPWQAGAPEANYTEEQWAALHKLVEQMEAKYPKAKVIGHREISRFPKACPSFDVQEWLAKYRPFAAPTRR